ncbi:MAG: hypothetical protein F4087_14340 [Gemmatimonadetes bacterium]|nr:hypothetical protein [Gemmatimonadota bacterium]
MVKGAVMREPGPGDFDLDAQVGRWRARQQRTSSLSPRELDELEDHLRARVNLEMELNAAIAPARAFHIASREMGTGSALSREFARAGKPRWKGLFAAGWAMFAASFLLPVTGFELLPEYLHYGRASGFEVFLRCLRPSPFLLLTLPNLAMLCAIPAFRGGRPAGSRRLRRFLGCAGVGALGLGIALSSLHLTVMTSSGASSAIRALLGPGYWTWAASFLCVATALHLRARGWASAALNGPARTAAPEGDRV